MYQSSNSTSLSDDDDDPTAATKPEVNYTATVYPTDLRMNDYYVFWYNNLAKLIITGESV